MKTKTGSSNPHELVIEAGSLESRYWREVWNFRSLLAYLAWRDISVRYKQTVLGVSWALIQPLIAVLVFTFIFQKLAKFESEEPYPLIILCGQLAWQFFSNSLNQISQSFVANQALVTKTYFPRFIIPLGSMAVAFVDFLIAFAFLGLFLIYFQFVPSWQIIFVPVFIALTALTSLSVGLIVATLNVKFRDFKYIIPLFVQFGMYLSPVGYLTSEVPERFRLIYSLNPLVGVIDGMRWCILGGNHAVYVPGLILSVAMTSALLFVGIKLFRKMERTFADVI